MKLHKHKLLEIKLGDGKEITGQNHGIQRALEPLDARIGTFGIKESPKCVSLSVGPSGVARAI